MPAQSTVAARFSVEHLADLPTLPEVYTRLLAALDDPGARLWDVEHIVRRDPVLTARLLRIARGGGFSPGLAVTTVADAVRLVGYDTLSQLALTTSVLSLFRGEMDLSLSHRAFWEHCLATAAGARQIALSLGEDEPEEFFVAGLLHDVGKLVLSQSHPAAFRSAVALAVEEHVSLLEAEERVLGFTHAEAGGALLEAWDIDPTITHAVANHHSPLPPDFLAPGRHGQIVHCADLLACALGLGQSGSPRLARFSPQAWEQLELPLTALSAIAHATIEEFHALSEDLFGGHGA